MSNINKQALRSKARSASAGEWIKESGDGWEAICSTNDQANGNFIIAHFEGPDARANREFAQAANPDTVLALLDELEAAEHTAAVDHEAACSLVEENEELKRKLEAAEKRIAELEAREVRLPPTFWYEHDDLPREIPVLSRRLVINALREAGVKIASGIGKEE
ncbi:ead/Ea22-like family protein [Citrobacter amalonaticus]|uniref:Ead/Ea22-like family protein n=1 Tax=Citrobacter amalonaticus TaxID=35703 RepID=A0A8I0JSL3_CITAM|nr:ead/Ea22-like family protein [Citrobacter amalonaticus]MBE0126756.1 hypothetical protein [Citrobacter amalonaticus]